MIQFTVQTEIARPPAEVFAYATEPRKLATWQTNTISAVAEDNRYCATLKQVLETPPPSI